MSKWIIIGAAIGALGCSRENVTARPEPSAMVSASAPSIVASIAPPALASAAPAAPSASASTPQRPSEHLTHDLYVPGCKGEQDLAVCQGQGGHACFLVAYCAWTQYRPDPKLPPIWPKLAERLAVECEKKPAACTDLGELLHRGLGGSTDYAKAAELFKKGCDGKDGRGCTRLGELIEDGLVKGEEKPGALYKRACGLNDPDGCLKYADVAEGEEARIALQKACAYGMLGCQRLRNE